MASNMQINQTSYYLLPCGKYLEDFIYAKGLNFNMGSALKYRWRAGHKDGESLEKDTKKCAHYVWFEATCRGCGISIVNKEVNYLLMEAEAWDGKVEQCDSATDKESTQIISKPIDMSKRCTRWEYDRCLRVMNDLLFIAREREYSGIEALGMDVLEDLRSIGTLCGIVESTLNVKDKK